MREPGRGRGVQASVGGAVRRGGGARLTGCIGRASLSVQGEGRAEAVCRSDTLPFCTRMVEVCLLTCFLACLAAHTKSPGVFLIYHVHSRGGPLETTNGDKDRARAVAVCEPAPSLELANVSTCDEKVVELPVDVMRCPQVRAAALP